MLFGAWKAVAWLVSVVAVPQEPLRAGCDKDSGMVIRPPGRSPARLALEECRRQAQKCIDESTKAQSPTPRADWLALAEQWVNLAERLADRE
jgi:hypothetical protein